MDRDAAHLEVMRLVEHYRSLPYPDLLVLADGDAIETQFTAKGELVTLSVDVRHSAGDSVRINVSAFGNNWWKHERIDESVLVTAASNSTT